MNKDDLEYEFNFPDAGDFMSYFIVQAASMASEKLKKDIDNIWPEMFVNDETVRWKLKVQLNGVELPVVKVFELMDKSYEKMVTEKAISLIKDRIDQISFVVDDVLEEVHEKVEAIFHDIRQKTFTEVEDD